MRTALHTFVKLMFLDENNDVSHKTLQKRLFRIKNGKAGMTQRREEVL
jgi:hypothetical protein